jgi:AcrR family transcriptional regulator
LRYDVKVGRPREHNEQTAAALLEAAERTVQSAGLGGLSVRGLADEVGTTTRAVYSLFGSKDGLLVALGTRAFRMLGAAVESLPATDAPASDLVDAGVEVFRRFAIEHPALFSIAVQRAIGPPALAQEFSGAADEAFAGLATRVARVRAAGLLGNHAVRDVACEFHALCEGLAALELRGVMTHGEEARIWLEALTALVAGYAQPAPRDRSEATAAPGAPGSLTPSRGQERWA